jgi:hypothetical protein
MPDLPTETVAFLCSDIEGSTRLLQHLGHRYADCWRSTDACCLPGGGWRARLIERYCRAHTTAPGEGFAP